jgi:deazaflavin-dependent oxidoreductase (nitroreductase family)
MAMALSRASRPPGHLAVKQGGDPPRRSMIIAAGARPGTAGGVPFTAFDLRGHRRTCGATCHPSWYYNLRANPRAIVVVDGVEVPVRAREVEGEERDRLWRTGVQIYPGWAAYERRAAPRRIPVFVLEASSD